MNNYYNVMDYGAQGNGVADDTAPIQVTTNACQANGGGRVYLPPGRYLVSNLNLPTGITLYGAGARVSMLLASRASGDILSVSGADVIIYDLGFTTKLLRTGGSYIAFQRNCYGCLVEKFYMEGAHIGIFLTGVNTIRQGSIRDTHPGPDSCGILVEDGDDQLIQNIIMDNPADQQPLAGIYVRHTQSLNITDCGIIHCGNDLLVTGAFSLYALNTFFDTAVCGVRILAQSPVERCHFLGCWTGSHSEHGFLIEPGSTAPVENIILSGHQSFFNKLSGIYLGVGNHLLVGNSQINQNGNGVYAAPATRRVLIDGNDCSSNISQNLLVQGTPQIVVNNFS